MTAPTRRAALGALASASALAMPAVTAAAYPLGPASDPAGSLAVLGAEFEAAWAVERNTDDDALEVAYKRTSTRARAIIDQRATSLADFRVKARAILWCYSGDYEELIGVLFERCATTDKRLLRSIVADLLVGAPETNA
jgi:hypothetical protein